MKYLCLIYGDEKHLASLPQHEMEGMVRDFQTFTNTIKANGQHVASHRLQPTHTASTVRVRDGKVSATDGPFAETKEQLAGFYLIESRDLNEAIQVAAKIPSARFGSVEVRPLWEMN